MAHIHPTAVIHPEANLHDTVSVGACCVIGKNVSIGEGTRLDSNVVITENVKIGKNNHLHANCVIGDKPQVLRLDENDKIGGLTIGDNNILREQVTIHPGMYPGQNTTIGNNNLLMIGVHIGHDCIVESKIVMSNFVQISGHCKIETGAWFSGMAASHQFVTIGKWSYIAGMAGITRDIPPFMIACGHYPLRIRGVNKRGLKRAGLSESQQQKINEAYKKLYRQNRPLLETANKLANQDGLDENVKEIIDAIRKSSKHRFGRYLELFRH